MNKEDWSKELFKLCVYDGDKYINEIRAAMSLGADVNYKNEEGITLLHMAAFGLSSLAVGLLVVNGADVNAVDCYNKTPLDYAEAAPDNSYEGEDRENTVSILLGYEAKRYEQLKGEEND